jgi:hypothetical protein
MSKRTRRPPRPPPLKGEALEIIGPKAAAIVEGMRWAVRSAARAHLLRTGEPLDSFVVLVFNPRDPWAKKGALLFGATGSPSTVCLPWPESREAIAEILGMPLRPGVPPGHVLAGAFIDKVAWLGWHEPILPDADVVDPWLEPRPGVGLDQACKQLFDKIPTAVVRFSAPADFFERLRQQIRPAVTIDASKEPLEELIKELPGFYATVSVMTDIKFEHDVKAATVVNVLGQRRGAFDYRYWVDFWTDKARDGFTQLVHQHAFGRSVVASEQRGRREVIIDCRAGEYWAWYVWGKASLGD